MVKFLHKFKGERSIIWRQLIMLLNTLMCLLQVHLCFERFVKLTRDYNGSGLFLPVN